MKRRTKPINKLSKTDAAYIAGFIDGDGHLRLYDVSKSDSFTAFLEIVQNTLPVLEWIQTRVGFGSIKENSNSKRSSTHSMGNKACYRYRLMGWQAVDLLEQCDEFFIVKRDVVDHILEHYGVI